MDALTTEHVVAWMRRYAHAWQERDPELVVDLFTEDATYRSYIYAEPHVGHDGIRAYWARATGSQRDVVVRSAAPFVRGHRAAVEWWTTMTADGEPTTLAGVLLLAFAADGRCSQLHEYWHVETAFRDPPAEWDDATTR